jgi:transglutaminase-like putative cysteine protease
MMIKIGFEIALNLQVPTAVIFLLRVHPSREGDLVKPEDLRVEPAVPMEHYQDLFGNRCGRVNVGAGTVRFLNEGVVRDSGELDERDENAPQRDVQELPLETLTFLLPSRYCEVDSQLLDFAWQRFASVAPGTARVQAICDFVYGHLRFDYLQARATRTAAEGFRERVGVCRDFTHLAITLCRCMNIPARYATGYLGDIGVPLSADPMDFSAWFEVFLGDRWYTFDARHNRRRIGRIVMARGRDAGDVPLTMVFGRHTLETFRVVTDEMREREISGGQVQDRMRGLGSTARLA